MVVPKMQSMMLRIQVLSRDVNTTFTSHAFLNGWKEVMPAPYVIRYQLCVLQMCAVIYISLSYYLDTVRLVSFLKIVSYSSSQQLCLLQCGWA